MKEEVVRLATDLKNLRTTTSHAISSFGNWERKNFVEVYHAPTDGIVIAMGHHHREGWKGAIGGYTDSDNPPKTLRVWAGGQYQGEAPNAVRILNPTITMPVRAGDYWTVGIADGEVTKADVFWIPFERIEATAK
jgi:hypothetical protein